MQAKLLLLIFLVFVFSFLACKKDEPLSTSPKNVKVGIFQFSIPSDWEILKGNEEKRAKKEIEASIREMLKSFSGNKSGDTSFYGMTDFKVIRLSSKAGLLSTMTANIPPQEDYMKTMEEDQKQKLEWGIKQGMVNKIIGHERIILGGTEMLKVEAEMKQGARMISLNYWSPHAPSVVGSLSFIINPGHYPKKQKDISAILASLKVFNSK